jgi:hypothetical protein
MKLRRHIRASARLLCAVVALAAVLARAPHAAAPTLQHLGGIDELRTWFNAGKGHTRLIFLLSPT